MSFCLSQISILVVTYLLQLFNICSSSLNVFVIIDIHVFDIGAEWCLNGGRSTCMPPQNKSAMTGSL